MAKYNVQLSVDMDADSPERAAEMVAEMADGWTYDVFDETPSCYDSWDDVGWCVKHDRNTFLCYTNTSVSFTQVHLENGVAQK